MTVKARRDLVCTRNRKYLQHREEEVRSSRRKNKSSSDGKTVAG